MQRIGGKVIVVPGAASGQGAAEAARLTEEGATVIGADLRAPDTAHGRELDVAAPDAWAAAVNPGRWPS
jgi:3alpha(or 20beta)-hydroxysteroid dehydrogenase